MRYVGSCLRAPTVMSGLVLHQNKSLLQTILGIYIYMYIYRGNGKEHGNYYLGFRVSILGETLLSPQDSGSKPCPQGAISSKTTLRISTPKPQSTPGSRLTLGLGPRSCHQKFPLALPRGPCEILLAGLQPRRRRCKPLPVSVHAWLGHISSCCNFFF